jgi:hypothetical protein
VGRTDGQLLASFIERKDETAFEALGRRDDSIIRPAPDGYNGIADSTRHTAPDHPMEKTSSSIGMRGQSECPAERKL